MNRTRLSEYIVLSLSAYITIIGVYIVLFLDAQTTTDRVILTLLFLFFSVLAGLYFRFENNQPIINLLLGLNTAVLLIIFFFSGRDLDVGPIFFVLSAYAMLFLPVRLGHTLDTWFYRNSRHLGLFDIRGFQFDCPDFNGGRLRLFWLCWLIAQALRSSPA